MAIENHARKTDGTRIVNASQIKEGMWLAYAKSHHNCRVVDVGTTPDGQVKLHIDYGHGGEPATQFFESSDRVVVLQG